MTAEPISMNPSDFTNDPEQKLDLMLRKGELASDKGDKLEAYTTRTSIVGLNPVLRLVGMANNRSSMSRVSRHAHKLGDELMSQDIRFMKLEKLYGEVSGFGFDDGDDMALNVLESLETFRFVKPVSTTRSFSIYPRQFISLGEKAGICGLALYQVGLICCAFGLVTLPGRPGYKRLLEAEINNFWRIMELRTQRLEAYIKGRTG